MKAIKTLSILSIGIFTLINIDAKASEKINASVIETDSIIQHGYTNGPDRVKKIEINVYRERRRNGRREDRNQRILNDYDPYFDNNAKTAHFSGFGIGFISMHAIDNDDISKDMANDVKMSSSLKFDLSFFDHKYSLGRNNMSFVTGLGIEFNSIHFISGKYLNYEDDKAFMATAPKSSLDNARFHITYLTVPLLIELNSGRYTGDFPFFINAGFLIKLKTMSSSKVWGSTSTETNCCNKRIISKSLGLKPVMADIMLQAGKGNWGLFFTYSLFSQFQKNMGPNVSSLCVGAKLYFSQR